MLFSCHEENERVVNDVEIEIKEEERIDELHRKGYRIIQNQKKFCFGMDAVLLSDFTRVKTLKSNKSA